MSIWREVFRLARSYPRHFTFYVARPARSFLPSYFMSVTLLTGIVLEELADFLENRGALSYRAKQVTDWIYKKRVASFDAMTDLPQKLRAELATEFDAPKMDVVRVLGSKDTTQKFLFRLRDQNLI